MFISGVCNSGDIWNRVLLGTSVWAPQSSWLWPWSRFSAEFDLVFPKSLTGTQKWYFWREKQQFSGDTTWQLQAIPLNDERSIKQHPQQLLGSGSERGSGTGAVCVYWVYFQPVQPRASLAKENAGKQRKIAAGKMQPGGWCFLGQ